MRVKALLMITYLALMGLYTYGLRLQPEQQAREANLVQLPHLVAGYVGADEPLNKKTLAVLGADQTAYRQYRRADGRPIWLFLGYFGSQQERSQIHSPKHCYPGGGWTIYDESAVEVTIDSQQVKAKRLLMHDGSRRQVVLYWFFTNSGIITNEYMLKWDQMKHALLRQSHRATFVRFSAPIGPDESADVVDMELTAFINAIAPHLLSVLNGGDTET